MVAMLVGTYILALIMSNCETKEIENLLTYTYGISASVVFDIALIWFFQAVLKTSVLYLWERELQYYRVLWAS